ncbi:hypothetical protein CT3_15760 [Comamonas terrigena NBRC 13299]|nr:hypothetical protein CT3_15760 [Comamonas terrigena NBRC 13299]
MAAAGKAFCVGGADAGGCAGDEDGRQGGHGGIPEWEGKDKEQTGYQVLVRSDGLLAAKKYGGRAAPFRATAAGAVAEGAPASVAVVERGVAGRDPEAGSCRVLRRTAWAWDQAVAVAVCAG